jgi:hypothetical protein
VTLGINGRTDEGELVVRLGSGDGGVDSQAGDTSLFMRRMDTSAIFAFDNVKGVAVVMMVVVGLMVTFKLKRG